MAVTIVHEVAHCVCFWAHRRLSGNEPFMDKGFDDKGTPEIGHSWELHVIGSCHSIEWDKAPNYDANAWKDLGWMDMLFVEKSMHRVEDMRDLPKTGKGESIPQYVYAMPMGAISDWFQEKTWENISRLGLVHGRPSVQSAPVLCINRLVPGTVHSDEEYLDPFLLSTNAGTTNAG